MEEVNSGDSSKEDCKFDDLLSDMNSDVGQTSGGSGTDSVQLNNSFKGMAIKEDDESADGNPPPTKFVISTIAYVSSPENSETELDSADEEEHGSSGEQFFDFDNPDSPVPFTTIPKGKISKDNFEAPPIPSSRTVNNFLQKLSENGLEKADETEYSSIGASIALNRMKSLSTRKNNLLKSELTSEVVTKNIRYERFGFYWHCPWYDQDGKMVEYIKVKTFYEKLKKKNPAKAREFRRTSEKDIPPPYQKLREHAKNHALTEKLVKEFRRDSDANVYLSLIDIDTEDFNGIYSAYLRIVKDSWEKDFTPTVMSTGYEYPKDEYYGRALQLASKIDRQIRVITAKHLPFRVYYPEPNTCILIPGDESVLPERFIDNRRGDGNTLESPILLANVLSERKNPCFIFSDYNPIITAIPDRARYKKNWKKSSGEEKPPIGFSEKFKQGAAPTEKDFECFKQISQHHYHDNVWYKSLFLNGAIRVTELKDDLLKCKDLVTTARNLEKSNSSEMNQQELTNVKHELKTYIPNTNTVETLVEKNAFQNCISLLSKFCKMTDNTDEKKDKFERLQRYITDTNVINSIDSAAADIKRHTRKLKKVFEILNENEIKIQGSIPREALVMLAERSLEELNEAEIRAIFTKNL